MKEIKEEDERNRTSDTLFSINQVRKRLGKSHRTITKLVKSGVIKSTKDGLISEASINEYLQKS